MTVEYVYYVCVNGGWAVGMCVCRDQRALFVFV